MSETPEKIANKELNPNKGIILPGNKGINLPLMNDYVPTTNNKKGIDLPLFEQSHTDYIDSVQTPSVFTSLPIFKQNPENTLTALPHDIYGFGKVEFITDDRDKGGFWGDFANMMDQTDLSVLRKDLFKIEQETAQLKNKNAKQGYLSTEEQTRLNELSALKNEISSNIEAEQQDIAEDPIRQSYRINQRWSELNEVSPSLNPFNWDYTKYMASKEIGSSAGLFGTQLAALGINRLSKMVAGALVESSLGGPVAPIVAGGLLIADIGTALYQRSKETSAEVGEAVWQKVDLIKNQLLEEKIRKQSLLKNRELTDEEKSQIFLTEEEQNNAIIKAGEGLSDLENKNNLLAAEDVMSIIAMATPWSKLLKSTLGANAITRTSGRLLGLEAVRFKEGAEEGLQWKFQNDYLNDNIESISIGNDILDVTSAMLGSTRPDFYNNPEFRNAVQSGMNLGAILGGAGTLHSQVTDALTYYKTKSQLKSEDSFAKEDLFKFKTDKLWDYFEQDRVNFLMEGLDNLKGNSKIISDEEIDATKDFITQAKKEYDLVTQPNKFFMFDNADLKGITNNEKKIGFEHSLNIIRKQEELKDLEASAKEYRDEVAQTNSHLMPSSSEEIEKKLNAELEESLNYTPFNEAIADAKLEIINSKEEIYDIASGKVSKENREKAKAIRSGNIEKIVDILYEQDEKLTVPKLIRKWELRNEINQKGIVEVNKMINNLIANNSHDVLPVLQAILENKVKLDDQTLNLIKSKIDEREVYLQTLNQRHQELVDALAELPYTQDLPVFTDEDYQANEEKLAELDLIAPGFLTPEQAAEKASRLEAKDFNDNTVAPLKEELAIKTNEKDQLSNYLDTLDKFNNNLPLLELKDESIDHFYSKSYPTMSDLDKARERKKVKDYFFKKEFANLFISNGDLIKDKFKNIETYANTEEVTKQISNLNTIKNVFNNRKKLLSHEVYENFIEDIESQIKEMEDIKKELEIRRQNRSLKQDILQTQDITFKLSTIGLNSDLSVNNKLINDLIKNLIGDDLYNRILDDFKVTNNQIYIDVIFTVIKNSISAEDLKLLTSNIDKQVEGVIEEILKLPRVKEEFDSSGSFERTILAYSKHNRVFANVIRFLSDPYDNKDKNSSIYQYLQDLNIYNFIDNIENNDKDRDSKLDVYAIRNDELLKLAKLHLNKLSLTKLKEELNNDRFSLTNSLVIEKRLSDLNSYIIPTKQQLISIRQIVRFLKVKSNSNSKFANWAYLKGPAGSGKTNIVMKWAYLMSGIKPDNLLVAGHNVHSGKVVRDSLFGDSSTKEVNTFDDLLTKEIASNIQLIVVDEIGAITAEKLKAFAEKVKIINEERTPENKLKVFVLGDPNQLTKENSVAINEVLDDRRNVIEIAPLTLVYRTNIAALVDFQDRFIDNNTNLRTTPIQAKSNTATPWSFTNQLKGVFGTNSFDTQIIQTLQNRNLKDGKTRAIITNPEYVEKYKNLLAQGTIENVEVLDYEESQGRTIDEVYVNILHNPSQFETNKRFNSAIYTATTRATNFVFIGGLNVINNVDPTITENTKDREDEVNTRKEEFKKDKIFEKEVLVKYDKELNDSVPVEYIDPQLNNTPSTASTTIRPTATPTTSTPVINPEEEEDEEVEDEVIEEMGEDTNLDINGEPIKSVPEEIENDGTISTFQSPDSAAFKDVVLPTGVIVRGIKEGDTLYFVNYDKYLNGQIVSYIKIVAQAFDTDGNLIPGMFRDVAILTEAEKISLKIDGGSIGLIQNKSINFDDRSHNNILTTNEDVAKEAIITSVVEKGSSPLTYEYKNSPVKTLVNNLIDIWKHGYFTRANRTSGNTEVVKVRIFNKKEAVKYNLNTGVPYLIISNPQQQNSKIPNTKLQFIQLIPRKLNKDDKVFSTLIEFNNLLQSLYKLIDPNIKFGTSEFTNLIKAEESELIKNYSQDVISIIKEIKDISLDQVDEEGEIIKISKVQIAFNELAKSNNKLLKSKFKIRHNLRFVDKKGNSTSIVRAKYVYAESTNEQNIKRNYKAILKQVNKELGTDYTYNDPRIEKEDHEYLLELATKTAKNIGKDDNWDQLKLDEIIGSLDSLGESPYYLNLNMSKYGDRTDADKTIKWAEEETECKLNNVSPTQITYSNKLVKPNITTTSNSTKNNSNYTPGRKARSFTSTEEEVKTTKTLSKEEIEKLYIKYFGKSNKEIFKMVNAAQMYEITNTTDIGHFLEDLILLQTGNLKVVRHEAFHKIFWNYLSSTERKKVLSIVREENFKNRFLNDEQLEEIVANKFMNWTDSKSRISSYLEILFKKFLRFLGFVESNILSLDVLFREIEQGYYSSLPSTISEESRSMKNLVNKFTIDKSEINEEVEFELAIKRYRLAKQLLSDFIFYECLDKELYTNIDEANPKVPITRQEALFRFKNNLPIELEHWKNKLELGTDPEAKLYLETYEILSKNKKGVFTILPEIYEDIYPNSKEEVNVSIAEDVKDAAEHNHKLSLTNSVKEWLSNIVVQTANGVKPLDSNAAYYLSLYINQAVDYSVDPHLIKIQLDKSFNSLSVKNAATEAVLSEIKELVNNASHIIKDKDNNVLNNYRFTPEGNFVILSKDLNKIESQINFYGNSDLFFKSIKELTSLPYSVIFDIKKRDLSKEVLKNFVTNTASLRERNLYIAAYTKVNTADSSGLDMVYYKAKAFDVKEGLKTSLLDAIQSNYTKVLNSKVFHKLKSNDKNISIADRKKAIYEILNYLNFPAKNFNMPKDTDGQKIINIAETFYKLFEDIKLQMNEDKNDADKIKEFINEQQNSRINEITNHLLVTDIKLKPSSIRNGEGKTIYTFHNSSFAIDTVNRLTKDFAYNFSYIGTDFYKQNIFISGKSKLHSYIDHDSIKNIKRDSATVYKGETEADWYNRTINASFIDAFSRNKNTYFQQPYTISNKPGIPPFEVDVIKEKDVLTYINIALDQELSRPDFDIATYSKLKNTIIFSPKLEKGKVVPVTIEEVLNNREQTVLKIQAYMNSQIELVKEKITNMVKENNLHVKAEELATKMLKEGYIEESLIDPKNKLVDVLAKGYFYNFFINSYFINQLVAGDQAFYKSSYDLIKRLSIAFAQGYKGLVSSIFGMKPTFRVIVADDVKGYSFDYLKKEYDENEEFRNYFKNVYGEDFDLTDAQGYITESRFKDIIEGFGVGMNLGKALKPVFFEIDKAGIPRAIKYSSIVLDDELCSRFPKLDELRKQMESAEVDEYVFSSGFKVGAPNKTLKNNELFDKNHPAIVTLNNTGYRIQLNPMHEVDSKVSDPSQLTYIIDANGMNEEESSKFYNYKAQLIKLGLEDILKDMGLITDNQSNINLESSTKNTKKRILNNLRWMLAKSMTAPGNEKIADALTLKKAKDYILSINFPLVVDKMISQFSSTVQTNSIKIKFPGTKLVLQSAFGVELYNNKLWSQLTENEKVALKNKGRDLKYASGIDGENSYVEVILPNMYKNYGLNENDIITGYSNNKFDLRKMLGFRIPSTDLHSAAPLKVVGFYDDKGTNVIIAPKEIVKLQGSDYDIDALYVIKYGLLKEDLLDLNNNFIGLKNNPIGWNHKTKKFDENIFNEYEKELIENINNLKNDLRDISKENKDDLKSIAEELKIYINKLNTVKKYKKALYKNLILDLYLNLITSKKNRHSMLTPISMDNFKDLQNESKNSVFFEIAKLLGIERKNYSSQKEFEEAVKEFTTPFRVLNNPLDQVEIFKDNFKSVNLTGAFALNAGAMMYLLKTSGNNTLNTTISIGGENYNEITRKNKDGILTIETQDTFVNAAIDHVKEQILNVINANNNTGPIYSVLNLLGVPLNTVVKYVMQPIFREEVLFSKKGEYSKKIKETLITEYNSRKESTEKEGKTFIKVEDLKDTLPELSVKNLEKIFDKENFKIKNLKDLSIEELLIQFKVVEEYEKIETLVNDMQVFQKAISVIKELPINFSELEEIEDAWNEMLMQGPDNTKVTREGFSFNIDNIFKNTPHIDQAYKSFKFIFNKTKQLFYVHNAKLINFSNRLRLDYNVEVDKTSSYKTESFLRKEFIKYLSSTYYKTDNEKYTVKKGEEEKVYLGLNAFNKKIINDIKILKDYFTKNGIKNELLLQMIVIENEELVVYGNKGLEQDDYLSLELDFRKLKNYSVVNDEVVFNPNQRGYNKLQNDLVKYTVLNKGLEFNSSSIANVMPLDIFQPLNKYIDEKLNLVIDSDSKNLESNVVNLDDITLLNNIKDDFMIQFAINFPEYIKGELWKYRASEKNGIVTSANNKTKGENLKYGILVDDTTNKLIPLKSYEINNNYDLIGFKTDDVLSKTNLFPKIIVNSFGNTKIKGTSKIKQEVFIKVLDNEESNKVYYRKVGNNNKTTRYNADILDFFKIYDLNDYFNLKTKNLEINERLIDTLKINKKYEMGLGEIVNIANYQDPSRKNSAFYKITEVTPHIKGEGENKTIYYDYVLEKQPFYINKESIEIPDIMKEGENIDFVVEEFSGFWSREQVAAQTDKVFLFGDNTNDRTVTKHIPSMTQAVIRGLSNAIGIDTKKDRGTTNNSYLTDNDFDWFKNHVDTQIQKAKNSGKTIVIPADGIGTGKAMLKEKAPKLFEYLQQELNKLKEQQLTPQQKQQAQQLYSQYLDITQNQFISPNDKVIFGHPTVGKSFLKKQGEDKFITLDDDYANEVNAFVDANRGSETRQEYKGRKPKEYNKFMLDLYDRLKVQAQREGKILFVSNTNILKERMSDFDKVITIPKAEFKRRFDERGATYGFEDWKSDIDATVAKVPNSKVITTTGYLADLFRGSKQDIEGFKEFVSKNTVNPNQEVKQGVSELFESNSELTNAVYESLRFNNLFIENKIKNENVELLSIDDIKFKNNEKYTLEELRLMNSDELIEKLQDSGYTETQIGEILGNIIC